MHHGVPKEVNPFYQVFLPQGFLFENKKSKAVSYASGTIPLKRGTIRTEEQAKACISSWSWQWWGSLTSDQKSAIQAVSKTDGVVGTRSKKRRCA